MAQAQAEKTPNKSDEPRNQMITRVVRCTSDGGETSSVVNFATYGMAVVQSASAYSQTGSARITDANTVKTLKATVTVTHTANHTVIVVATGYEKDIYALV